MCSLRPTRTRSGCHPGRSVGHPSSPCRVVKGHHPSGRASRARRECRRNASPAPATTTMIRTAVIREPQAPSQAATAVSRCRGRRRALVDLLELDFHVGHVLEALVRLLAQAAQDQLVQVLRQVRPRSRSVASAARASTAAERLGPRASCEGSPSGHHLVEQAPEGEDVAARVDLAARRLLRRHVARRARDRPRPAHEGSGRFLCQRVRARRSLLSVSMSLARPKSRTLTHALGRHDHVGGLQVAVDDAGRVGAARASAIGIAMRSTSKSRIRERMSASSVLPGTYSMTMKSDAVR